MVEHWREASERVRWTVDSVTTPGWSMPLQRLNGQAMKRSPVHKTTTHMYIIPSTNLSMHSLLLRRRRLFFATSRRIRFLDRSTRDEEPLVNAGIDGRRGLVVTSGNVQARDINTVGGVADGGVGTAMC